MKTSKKVRNILRKPPFGRFQGGDPRRIRKLSQPCMDLPGAIGEKFWPKALILTELTEVCC